MNKVVIGIIEHGDRYAFLERKDGHWTFPSGKVEDTDNSDETALVREIKEETDLDVTVGLCLGQRMRGSDLLIYYKCSLEGSSDSKLKLMEPDKFNKAEWKPASEIIGIAGEHLFAPVLEVLMKFPHGTRKLGL